MEADAVTRLFATLFVCGMLVPNLPAIVERIGL
jgi:hypothetical protein